MEKEKFSCIGDCVDNAIEVGNHEAFVEFFLNSGTVKFYKDLFIEKYQKLIKNQGELYAIPIFKSKYWRSIKYKMDTLSGANEKEIFHDKSNKESWWYDGVTNVPDKDTLVQIGIYYRWGYETVNKLLCVSGQRQLYPLDIVDAIGMYYLENFKDNSELSYEDKLKVVKDEINIRIEAVDMRELNISTKEMGFISAEDMQNEFEKLMEICNVNGGINDEDVEQKDIVSYTRFVTEYVGSKLKEAIENNVFDAFFENVKSILARQQYGYLRRTFQYIDSIEKYRKNMYYPGYVFSSKLTEEEILNMLGNGQKKRIWNGGNKVNSIKEKIRWMNEIWQVKNVLKTEVQKERLSGSRFVIRQMVMGREQSEDGPLKNEKTKRKKYIIKNDNILNLIKFAIVAGREDELGEYLIRSGHRQENLNNLIKKEFVYEEGRVWEKTDSLIVYCIYFRDRLIDEWSKQFDEQSRVLFKQDAKNKFPMIQLMMTVNEQIQENEDYKNWEKKYVNQKTNRLIFPVIRSEEDEKNWGNYR